MKPSIQIVHVLPPRWVEPAGERERGVRMHRIYHPGDAWYATKHGFAWYAFPDLRPEDEPLTLALQHVGVRPILVVLPNDALFCLHSPTLTAVGWGELGWSVEGDLDHLAELTVRPSINYGSPPHGWHGYLQRGQLQP